MHPTAAAKSFAASRARIFSRLFS